MGILNVTPDSFSDGGRFLDRDKAVSHGMEMIAAGADIVDVGGESTRPGADPVAEDEEKRRVVDVVRALSPHVRVSIDTKKPRVAEAAIDAGATILNDVTASLEKVAGTAGVTWIAMHSRGDPKTMGALADYTDVVGEVRAYLRAAVERGRDAGVPEVWIDPGIGFAKTAAQSWALVSRVGEMVADGPPVVLGASRKSFLAQASKRQPGGTDSGPRSREDASLAVATWAMLQGVSIVRVHEVAPAVQAATLARAGNIASDAPAP